MADFRVLFLCTGNICRSPIAERLFGHRLREELGATSDRFDVRSAGTLDLGGAPMDPAAQWALADLDIPADGHESQPVTAQLVESADLVLTATRQHRGAALELCPRASARTFTITEFGRLAALVPTTELTEADPVDRARQLVAAAARRRGSVPVDDPEADDLADPLGLSSDVFAATAARVDAALRGVVHQLVTVPVRGSGRATPN